MKKKLLSILLTGVVLYLFAAFAYSEESALENAGIKIVIDGKSSAYENVPIIVGDRTLLPFREILLNLGVQDDEQHIIWNDAERSVTVYEDSVKIFLKIGSNTAYINDAPVQIDVAPVIYKNRSYIPARFISQSMGKKVSWYEKTNTVAICDPDSFDKVNGVILKSDAAMESVKFKSTFDMNMELGGILKSAVTFEEEQDPGKKLEHSVMRNDENGAQTVTETYRTEGAVYEKEGSNGKWIKTDPGEVKDGENLDLSVGELLNMSAGLVFKENAGPGEIVLEGDIGFINLFDAKNDPDYKVHTIMVIDEEGYFIREVSFKMSGTAVVNSTKFPYIIEASCKFYDYGGDFSIELPEDLPD